MNFPFWRSYNNWFNNAVTTDAKTDRFVEILLEIVAPFNGALEFLFRGENIKVFIDDLEIKGGNGWADVFEPLGMALGVDLKVADGATAVDCVEKLLNGVLGLVDTLGAAPINTLIDIVAGLSYFLASDGVEEAVEGILAPIVSLLSLLEAVIDMDDINAVLKGLINMDLNDIADIAGDTGDKLVAMLNDLIGGVELKDKVTGETYTANLLPATFFLDIAEYAISYNADDVETLAEGEVGYDYQPGHQHVTSFEVDGADGLMYVLSTVCSEDFLAALATKLGKDVSDDKTDMIENIILGLAGKQDNIVDILVTLLTDYTVTYTEYTRPEIDKIDVEHNDPMNDDNLEKALAALDPIIEAVIGMFVKDADSLEGLVTNLVANADLGNLIMGLLVPVLADLDIDEIIGYVNDLTNLDIAIDPQTFATSAKFGSELKNFIGNAETWADVEAKYEEYVYTYEP